MGRKTEYYGCEDLCQKVLRLKKTNQIITKK